MGLFDSFLRQLDNGLKSVESGELEKRLDQFAEAVEKKTDQAGKTLDKMSKAPGEVLEAAEAKKEVLKHKAQAVGKQARKALDDLQKKD